MVRQESGSAKTPTWVGSCKVSVNKRGRAEWYRSQESVESSTRVVGRVTLRPGWACTGQAHCLLGSWRGTKVQKYGVPRVPE